MKLHRLFLLPLLLLAFSACSPYKKGLNSFKQGEYQVAIEHLEKALKNKKANKARINYLLAESYRLSNRIDEAAPFYAQAVEANIPEEEAAFYYGLALKAQGEYGQARAQMDRYLSQAQIPDLKKRAEQEMLNLQQVDELVKPPEPYFQIKALSSLNTEFAEYAPAVRENELYFTSSRGDGKEYKATGQPFTDLFKAEIGQKMEIAPNSVKALGDNFNLTDRAEGAIAFNPQGTIMVFARGNAKGKKGGQEVNLYASYWRGNNWTEPQPLRISDPRAWDSTPAFSKNGKTLYFASNRRGGQGGIDLYSAELDARGNFVRVRNMGPEINTAGNEMFPYVAQNGQLYFSSDGHPGLGGLDLFVATRKDGKIQVENLNTPMNSTGDDFGLVYSGDDRGYFSSNREGGAGDDDLYAFINSSPDIKIVNYYLEGVSYTPMPEGNRRTLPEVRVRLLDDNGQQLATTVSDEKGNFRFELEEGVLNYTLIGEKPDYFVTRRVFPMEGKYLDKRTLKSFRTDTTFTTELELDPIVIDKAIVLENIYYDFDKADIRPDAARELDKLVTILKDNPQLVIELSSHTDSRGDLAYNIDLSQRRAESAVNYIVSQGVAKRRISARGYGKTRPIIADAQTEEEHQVNRRTEFKVTEIIPEADVQEAEAEEPDAAEDVEQEEVEADTTESEQTPRRPQPKKKDRDEIFDELEDGQP